MQISGWLKLALAMMFFWSIGYKTAVGQSSRLNGDSGQNPAARPTDPNAPARLNPQGPSSIEHLFPPSSDDSSLDASPAIAAPTRQGARALRVVDQFVRRLRSCKSYSCRVTDCENITHNSIQVQAQTSFTIMSRRPDRLALLNPNGASLWSGAEGVFMFNPLTRQFSASGPVANDQLWISPEYSAVIEDIPLLNFLLSPPQWQMLKNQPLEWNLLDDETLHNVNCHHVTLTFNRLTIHLWFESEGDKPLRQIAAAMDVPATDKPQDGIIKSAARWTFDDWKFDQELDESLFKTTIPQDAWPESRNLLSGQPAPLFSAPLLNGQETFDLARHRDKQIVVLDFWATWCGPCRKGLPILDRLARIWSKDSVAVYAVNVSDRDTVEQIREFMQQNQLQLPVVIGHDPEVGQKYRVSGIPQTVIIGKNGVIQHVHVGLAPNMGEVLQKQVAELLKGGERPGVLGAPKADVSCSQMGFSTAEPGKPAAFWCEITNTGPDALPAERLTLKLKLNKNKNLEDTHLVAKPLAAGETLRYEIPQETWTFIFAADAKGEIELVLDPHKTLNDANRKNNHVTVALPIKAQKTEK